MITRIKGQSLTDKRQNQVISGLIARINSRPNMSRLLTPTSQSLVPSDAGKVLVPGTDPGDPFGTPPSTLIIPKDALNNIGDQVYVVNRDNTEMTILSPGFGDGGNLFKPLDKDLTVQPYGTLLITFVGQNAFYLSGDLVAVGESGGGGL